jgi:hypothetical protein
MAANDAAQAQPQDAVLAYCKLIRRGLDRLDVAGRSKLLRMLVDRVVVHPRRLELHGVLHAHDPSTPADPNGSGRNRTDSPHDRPRAADTQATRERGAARMMRAHWVDRLRHFARRLVDV